MKEFEEQVIKIFNYTHEYAINNLPFNHNIHPSEWSKSQQDLFAQFVHLGFRKAQDLILSEMLVIEENIKTLKLDLKVSRKNRDKDKIKKIENNIKIFNHKELILRHFADFIAWQILGQQYYKVRRFHNMKDKYNTRPTLSESNLDSIISAVDYYHKQNPSNFALMSDLTSFIDIGDILLIENYEVKPIEIKEGKKNKEIFDFLFNKDIEISPDKINDKFLKQAKRVLNQAERGIKLNNFFKNDSGKDPFMDCNVQVNEKEYIMESYADTVNKLLLDLNHKDWAYSIVENIITIGIYQKQNILMGDILIQELNKMNYGKEFPVTSYLQTLQIPISEPIVYKGFPKDKIFDILFGRIRIILSINLDNFIQLCNDNNLNARYLSKKETMNRKKKGDLSMYEFNKQNIIINENTILGDGIIVRMLFDFTKPSSIIKSLKQQIEEFDIQEVT